LKRVQQQGIVVSGQSHELLEGREGVMEERRKEEGREDEKVVAFLK
jgi:hypothetical protein